ncbi:hypothetical protein GGS23DRAFT_518258 [Durotheca rogersii]|uniref:uncharacterized protein n=1 Tax=Durotheca rogersii TaxID=419775 RepID=UPI00221F7C68|nr:uncharacterized protein GGS23DRAFT_518258 [Durotheca rogersii]KAI5863880.1 hypothetical protein GGS23DRAFT_518258 [Durotheca rogersii]
MCVDADAHVTSHSLTPRIRRTPTPEQPEEEGVGTGSRLPGGRGAHGTGRPRRIGRRGGKSKFCEWAVAKGWGARPTAQIIAYLVERVAAPARRLAHPISPPPSPHLPPSSAAAKQQQQQQPAQAASSNDAASPIQPDGGGRGTRREGAPRLSEEGREEIAPGGPSSRGRARPFQPTNRAPTSPPRETPTRGFRLAGGGGGGGGRGGGRRRNGRRREEAKENGGGFKKKKGRTR